MGKATQTQELRPVTSSQMDALERFIAASRDASEFAKKAVIWMLRQTAGLTRPVCLSFPPERAKFGKQAAYGVHDMCSKLGSTHIDDFMRKMGTPMKLSAHGGSYVKGELDSESGGYTVWVSPRRYDHGAERLEVDIRAIRSVELPKG